MPSAGALRAGKAVIEMSLTGTSAIQKGLKSIQAKVKAFGSAVFTGMKVLGGASLAAAAVSVKAFTSMGDELAKMSDRTGLSVENLSELKHAAGQSGTSLEDVEKALRQMAKNGMDVNTFDQVAAQIAAIEDPTQRAKAAMEVWGKSGTALLPMIGGLQELRQEARDLGLVMSGETANAAVRLGDAFANVWNSIKMMAFNLGAAIEPVISMILPPIQNLATLGVQALAGMAQGIKSTIGPAMQFLIDAWAAVIDFLGPTLGTIRAHFEDVFGAIASLISSVWSGVGESTEGVWSSIANTLGSVLTWLRDAYNTALSGINFAIKNWQLLAETAFVSAELAVVTFANQAIHFFTVAIPGYLDWFGNHWREVFTDIVNFTATVATNIWKNLVNLWNAIEGLFSGEGWNFEFTPLTEGFESAITALPEIAEREIGPLEQQLKDELDGLASEVNSQWEKHKQEFGAKVDAFTPSGADFKAAVADLANAGDAVNKVKAAQAEVDEGAAVADAKKSGMTQSAFDTRFAGQQFGNRTEEEMLDVQKKIEKHLRPKPGAAPGLPVA